jgi:hypothetical protein
MIKQATEMKMDITLIELLNENITVQFNDEWYQEDIESLSLTLFSQLTHLKIQERILGADRECIRFSWQGIHFYTLNFDYYSQSCWIESVDAQSMEFLPSLREALKITQ